MPVVSLQYIHVHKRVSWYWKFSKTQAHNIDFLLKDCWNKRFFSNAQSTLQVWIFKGNKDGGYHPRSHGEAIWTKPRSNLPPLSCHSDVILGETCLVLHHPLSSSHGMKPFFLLFLPLTNMPSYWHYLQHARGSTHVKVPRLVWCMIHHIIPVGELRPCMERSPSEEQSLNEIMIFLGI